MANGSRWATKLAALDAFIEKEIKPLEAENIQYFDYRREHARTDWDNDGVPRREWEELLAEMKRRAWDGGIGESELPPYQHRRQAADTQERQAHQQELDADDLVVCREYVFPKERHLVGLVCSLFER